MKRDYAVARVTFCIAFLFSSLLLAQTQTGSINGTVQDGDRNPIPGVIITASSPSLLGGSATTTTDRDGSYRFPWLTSGTYEVQAELAGFQAMIQKDVRIFVGATLTVDFAMELIQTAEAIQIIGQPPLIDESTTAVSFTIPPEMIVNLPKAQRIQDLIVLTPGVSVGDRTVDDLRAYGGHSERTNAYSFDGVSISSLRSGTIFAEFNYNWIEQVHITGIGAPAEYGGFSGITANFVTRSGGNQFHGLFETFFQNEKLTSSNTPEPEEEVPFTSYDISTQLGGPILKDRLWFFSGFEYSQRENHPAGYPGTTKENLPKFIAKLNYRLNENNSLQGFFHRNSVDLRDVGANENVRPEATQDFETGETSWNATWISIFTPRTNFEGRFGGFHDHSKSKEDQPDLSGHYDSATNIFSVNSRTRSDATEKRLQLNATLSHHASEFLSTAHDFRFGVEFQRSDDSEDIAYNGGFFYNDYNGPDQRQTTIGQNFKAAFHRTSIFAEDDFQLSDDLTLSLGVRWDHNRATTNRGEVFATDPVAPRIGFVWVLNESNQTILKAHYSDYYDALNGTNFYFLSASPVTIIQRINEAGEWVETERFREEGLPNDNLKNPRVRQFTIGFDRILPGQVPIGAHYIYRRFGNVLESVGSAEYEPVVAINPLTGEPITVYKQVGDLQRLYTNPAGLYRRYHGFELFANKQFGAKLSLSGSFVYSHLEANAQSANGDTIFLNNPNTAINFEGLRNNDFSWKFFGTYALPWGFNAGWFYRHESGGRWTARATIRFDGGQAAINAEPVGSRKLEAQNIVDLRLEKAFNVYTGQLHLTADIFNLFNNYYVTSILNNVSFENFGLPANWNQPRKIRLGIRYTF